MRVYEFAKQKGLSSKEIIALLDKKGFDVASHMSVLSDDAVSFLEKTFAVKKGAAAKSASTTKKAATKKVAAKKVVAKPAATKKAVTKKKAVAAKPSVEKKAKPVVVKTKAVVAKPSVRESKPLAPKPSTTQITKKGLAVKQVVKKTQGPRPSARPILSRAGKRAAAAKKRQRRVERQRLRSQKITEPPPTEVTLHEEMPLYLVASMLRHPEGEIILFLLKKGMVCNRNHTLSVDLISEIAHHYGIKVLAPEGQKEAFVESRLAVEEATAAGKASRWPIVVVMGHVDHGKTSLLDYVRKMDTAAREKGGITQHLSAYEVDGVHGKVVFLDTPGHEAFSYMRKRGTSVTDLVVLIVAADDGIMPQTVEVINHIKAADVPLVVAINKIDKVDRASAIEKVKRQLAQYDLLPEDWGGTVVCVPISAKTGEGVEELLEMITLQAQMMELKADPESMARGFILESKQEKGFGPVATVICLNGTLRVGDYFVCGASVGKVRLLVNSHGERVMSAGPSIPVQVVGFDTFVSLGDWLTVVSRADYMQEKAARKKDSTVRTPLTGVADTQVSTFGKPIQMVPVLIKTDTHGSKEAVLGELEKINKKYPDIPSKFQVIYSGIGPLSVRDIDLAMHAGALVMCLHVRTEKNATVFAREHDVAIQEFEIIYKMVEKLEALLKEHEEEVVVLKKTGLATVKKVFDLGKRGVIAGCYVSEGVVSKDSIVQCFRRNDKIGQGKIVSLQRERKTVKEVKAGHECGFITDSFHDWKEDDTVQIFIEEKKKRSEV